jgi:hypothetical protein
MRIRVLTIFPELFGPFLATSLVGRAIEKGLLDVEVHDLREHTEDRHRSVDDEPYGGGGGMVMMAPPWIKAVRAVGGDGAWRILLSPQGSRLDEAKVRELAAKGAERGLVLMCGRYEGIDERVRRAVVDEEVSIGDCADRGPVAAGARGGEAGGLGGAGQLPDGPAGLSTLHPSAGGGGSGGPGGADLGEPRRDPAVAGTRGAPGDPGEAAGPSDQGGVA